MIRHLLLCALCAVALVGCGGGDDADEAASSEPPAWNHDPDDAELGPGAWGDVDRSFETCRTGLNQSPVDITGTDGDGDLPDLEPDYPAAPIVVENTGHTIEVPMPDAGEQTLTIEGDQYRLRQFHFHAPSEHTLEGGSFEAEAHLVHESERGEIAVVGIFLERSEQPNELVDAILDAAPEEAGEEVELDEERSPLELFPVLDATTAEVDAYATYPGSLTTPPCAEGLRWFVLESSLGVSEEAIDRLHELIADFPDYDGYENNNRPAQPLNDREIQTSG